LQELKALQIRLVVPDVNRSGLSFQVEGQSIRFPLTPIKDLQGKLASSIVDERNLHGPYTDFFDFASRLKSAGLNLRILVRLVDAGAFDSLCSSRQTLRASAASAMQYADLTGGEENGQQFLTDIGIAKPLLEREPDDLRANLEAEYNALGMMVSGSPLSLYQDEIKKLPHYCPLHELGNAPYHTMTAGVLRGARAITTKSGKKMAFLELYDEVSVKEFTVFPSVYEACYAVLTTGAVLAVECHKDDRKDGTYIIDSARALGENEP
jgi:DNA polymerase-3 subunit alpha